MAQTVSSDRVYLDADELIQDQQQGLYIARGDVRLQSGDRVLFAQELIYNPPAAACRSLTAASRPNSPRKSS